MKFDFLAFLLGAVASLLIVTLIMAARTGEVYTLPYGELTCVVRRDDVGGPVTQIESCYLTEGD